MMPDAVSSREGTGRSELAAPPIAQECTEDLQAAVGKGKDCLGVALARGRSARVELTRLIAVPDAEQRRVGEDALGAAGVSLRAPQGCR